MFLRNYWYVAATSEEVGRELLERSVLNEPIVMYRTESGDPVAIHDVCPHRSLPFSDGSLHGDKIQCDYHGLQFDTSGKCTRIPGQLDVPARLRVKTYPIVEKWRYLWIWMGEPDKADEADIPDFHWNQDPDWTPTNGYFYIKCHYELLVDNLLDLSHETFVHPTTIGNMAVAETPVTTTSDGDTVRVLRQIDDHEPPPAFVKWRGFTSNIDRTQDIRWSPPSTIVIRSHSVPTGANDPDMTLEYRVINGITPATEKSVHHFWGVPRNFNPEHEVTDAFQQGSHFALSEDVGVLERCQDRINEEGADTSWVNIHVDEGGNRARGIVKKLIKAEQGAQSR